MLSMTGFGEAQRQQGELTVRVEIRSVNNRHLKLSCRLPDGYSGFEPQLESILRDHVRRGSLQLSLVLQRAADDEDYGINETLLAHYHQQIQAISAKLHGISDVNVSDLLQLPGVIIETTRPPEKLEEEWSIVEETLRLALDRFNQMRNDEGEALAADLRLNCKSIEEELDQIETLAPRTVKAYEVRLLDRISQLLVEHDLKVEPAAVIREVGIFADRVDISEEIVRLRSHLRQFDVVMRTESSAGRKLEFLIQELLRETNTIGSKGSDAQIARHVVQIKTNIERLREMIQNVE